MTPDGVETHRLKTVLREQKQAKNRKVSMDTVWCDGYPGNTPSLHWANRLVTVQLLAHRWPFPTVLMNLSKLRRLLISEGNHATGHSRSHRTQSHTQSVTVEGTFFTQVPSASALPCKLTGETKRPGISVIIFFNPLGIWIVAKSDAPSCLFHALRTEQLTVWAFPMGHKI